MFCNRCRINNANNANYCQNCGQQLEITGLNDPTALSALPIDDPTVLSSPPVYALAYGNTSSVRDVYRSIGPNTPPPPPPPNTPAVGIAHPYEQQPLPARRKKSWIIPICFALIVLLMIAVGSYVYSNRSTPGKTLNTVCNAFKNGDFPTVYNQYSSSYQRQLGGEAYWEATTKQNFSSQGGLLNCTYSNVSNASSTGSAVMSLTFGNGYGTAETFKQALIMENGAWKISSSTRLT
ncbi:MAG: SurA N-terminal domain-containing protein [Chloroflexota bacterium]|nr:SurA N-terminal domain-containing protein [Chloroflexota bacterium]